MNNPLAKASEILGRPEAFGLLIDIHADSLWPVSWLRRMKSGESMYRIFDSFLVPSLNTVTGGTLLLEPQASDIGNLGLWQKFRLWL